MIRYPNQQPLSMHKGTIICVALGMLILGGLNQCLFAFDVGSPLAVTFKMKKDIFKVGEPVDGTVTIENTYPASLPATFKVSVYHNDILVDEHLTSVKHVPSGATDFSFKNFGIYIRDKNDHSVGTWSIEIIQGNLDESLAREISFQIVPEKAEEFSKDQKFKDKIEPHCGIENCHGVEITCGPNVPEMCTAMYGLGDGCRQYARCQVFEGKCRLVHNEKFEDCKACVDQCVKNSKEDPASLFACENRCMEKIEGSRNRERQY